MLVMGGMLLTLVAAQAAGLCTSLKDSPRHLHLEGCLTREDASRGVAHVGAVEVETYAWVTKNSFQQDVYLAPLFLPPCSLHRCAG
jgi:hypothetical protein